MNLESQPKLEDSTMEGLHSKALPVLACLVLLVLVLHVRQLQPVVVENHRELVFQILPQTLQNKFHISHTIYNLSYII